MKIFLFAALLSGCVQPQVKERIVVSGAKGVTYAPTNFSVVFEHETVELLLMKDGTVRWNRHIIPTVPEGAVDMSRAASQEQGGRK